jgi:phosphinothricin acetyltransferase
LGEDANVRPLTKSDWKDVRAIYLEGISTGNATFEREAPSWDKWDGSHLPYCRLVAEKSGKVVGWAALSAVSDRCVYSGVAETSIYVSEPVRRGGVGKALLHRLIQESEHAGIWTLQAGVFPENRASTALHKSCGFRVVGLRERLGELNGAWRDVFLLERRSEVLGYPLAPVIRTSCIPKEEPDRKGSLP